ncbi:hypothetical protein SESBI_17409 [Sesbania bispinosa]|nr:hypothetical protein SESBI_17409 [Sesbania bispinosa]
MTLKRNSFWLTCGREECVRFRSNIRSVSCKRYLLHCSLSALKLNGKGVIDGGKEKGIATTVGGEVTGREGNEGEATNEVDGDSNEENISDEEGDSSDESVRDIHFDDSEEERCTGLDDGFEFPTQDVMPPAHERQKLVVRKKSVVETGGVNEDVAGGGGNEDVAAGGGNEEVRDDIQGSRPHVTIFIPDNVEDMHARQIAKKVAEGDASQQYALLWSYAAELKRACARNTCNQINEFYIQEENKPEPTLILMNRFASLKEKFDKYPGEIMPKPRKRLDWEVEKSANWFPTWAGQHKFEQGGHNSRKCPLPPPVVETTDEGASGDHVTNGEHGATGVQGFQQPSTQSQTEINRIMVQTRSSSMQAASMEAGGSDNQQRKQNKKGPATQKKGESNDTAKQKKGKTSSSKTNPQQTTSLTPSQPQSEVVIPRVSDIVVAHMKLMGIIDNITSGQVDNWDEVSRDLSTINVAVRPAGESANSEPHMEGTLPSQSSQTKK